MIVKADGSKIHYFDLDELKQHPDTILNQANPFFYDKINHLF